MRATAKGKPTAIGQIKTLLTKHFPAKSITVRRENPAAIWVRIIDPMFHGKSIMERERLVRPLIHTLPDEVQADITVLLPISAEEAPASPMSFEFDLKARRNGGKRHRNGAKK